MGLHLGLVIILAGVYVTTRWKKKETGSKM